MPHGYPILLDVTRRRIVIIGGGRVAARKAKGLVEAGAVDITVVAPAFATAFPDGVRRIEQAYTPEVLEGAGLVFAATDRPEVNDQVVRDAQAKGVLVGRADTDESHPGDFVTAAKFQDDYTVVAVSAGSAALSASIRDALQRQWEPRWSKMAAAMQTLRPWVRDHPNLPPERRAAVFRLLAGDEAMDVLDRGDIASLRAWLVERHPELA